METGQGSVMNALHQRDRVCDELLRDRCRDTSKHQKGGLDGIMWFNEYWPLLVGIIRNRLWRKDEAIMPIVVVRTTEAALIVPLHKRIISLSFDILKCCKKKPVAKRILQQRQFPTREHPAKADFGQLLASVVQRVLIFAIQHISWTISSLQSINRSSYSRLDYACHKSGSKSIVDMRRRVCPFQGLRRRRMQRAQN